MKAFSQRTHTSTLFDTSRKEGERRTGGGLELRSRAFRLAQIAELKSGVIRSLYDSPIVQYTGVCACWIFDCVLN